MARCRFCAWEEPRPEAPPSRTPNFLAPRTLNDHVRRKHPAEWRKIRGAAAALAARAAAEQRNR